MIRHNGSRFLYVEDQAEAVPPSRQNRVFLVERGELPLLRKVFRRLLFLPFRSLPKPAVPESRERSVADGGSSEPARRPEVSPEERVLGQIRARHTRLRTHRHGEVSLLDQVIDRLEIAPVTRAGLDVQVDQDRVRIDPEHAALRRLLAGSNDELWWRVLMSSIYSAINAHHDVVTDEHEEHFLVDLSRV